MATLDDFREETRAWLDRNCPPGARGSGTIPAGGTKMAIDDADTLVWRDRMAEKGWTAPTWPVEYGGGGLTNEESMVMVREMQRVNARAPLTGMGVNLIGPTLLEFGTEDQKQRHIPPIIRGEVRW